MKGGTTFGVDSQVPGTQWFNSQSLASFFVEFVNQRDDMFFHGFVVAEAILWGVVESFLLPEAVVSIIVKAWIFCDFLAQGNQLVVDLVQGLFVFLPTGFGEDCPRSCGFLE